jgi:hypothetical protein
MPTDARRVYEEQMRKLLTLPEESPEADALRDAMDATGRAMTAEERVEMGRLTAQLVKEEQP